MQSGMLWYNGDKTMTLPKKVQEAALYFKKKYGRTPEICLINEKDAAKLPPGTPTQVDVDGRTVRLNTWRGIIPGHLWIGFETIQDVVSPETNEPVKNSVIEAFERHTQKATVQR